MIDMLWLGDMLVVGKPPAKLTKACAVIAAYLHDEWAKAPKIAHKDKSKESCILASTTVRRFLYRIGFKDAALRACFTMIRADKDGVEQHSLGIGPPLGKPELGSATKWDGHMVVTVAGFLIDTTLYQAKRPQWPDAPGMIVLPLLPPDAAEDDRRFEGQTVLSGFTGIDETSGNDVAMLYLDQPQNDDWQNAPDFQRKHDRERIVNVLVAQFGKWEE